AYALRLTRWLLERIENNDNAIKVDMSDLSIEHIMPQTITPYWEKQAQLSGEEYSELVNTIGNLTLVSKPDNSSAGNKDFNLKKAIFNDTLHLKMNMELFQEVMWTKEKIEQRTNDIINQFIALYPYQRAEDIYDFENERIVFINNHNIIAQGYLNEDETLIIYAGSQVSSKIKNNAPDHLYETRLDLIDQGIIEATNDGLVFSQDYLASSVSNAAVLLLGGTRNGWYEFKDSNGQSIGESLRHKK
ncbi:MAG: DUF4357 domain-containing protein, partial [Bacilli bacterium]